MRKQEAERLTLEQERAREALRAIEAPGADPEFRAALKRAFVAGALDERGERLGTRGLGLAWSPEPWWSRPSLRWAAATLALAASVLVVDALNRGPRWEVMSASGAGIAVIDDQPVPMNHIEELRARLKPGARVRIPSGSALEIANAGNLAIHLDPGTDAILPRAPGRWLWRAASAEVRAGELRITTGPNFRGGRLTVWTPAARVKVTGTTLAVICDPEGTCVCVFDGVVRVGRRSGPLLAVEHGRRGFVYNDRREPVAAPIRETELVELGTFRARSREVLEAGRR